MPVRNSFKITRAHQLRWSCFLSNHPNSLGQCCLRQMAMHYLTLIWYGISLIETKFKSIFNFLCRIKPFPNYHKSEMGDRLSTSNWRWADRIGCLVRVSWRLLTSRSRAMNIIFIRRISVRSQAHRAKSTWATSTMMKKKNLRRVWAAIVLSWWMTQVTNRLSRDIAHFYHWNNRLWGLWAKKFQKITTLITRLKSER